MFSDLFLKVSDSGRGATYRSLRYTRAHDINFLAAASKREHPLASIYAHTHAHTHAGMQANTRMHTHAHTHMQHTHTILFCLT